MAFELDTRALGARIRAAREQADLVQEDLGSAVGVRGLSISRIELGKVPDPRLSTIAGIADVLGVDLEWLVFGRQATREDRAVDSVPAVEAVVEHERASLEHAARLRAIRWGDVEPSYQTVRDILLDMRVRDRVSRSTGGAAPTMPGPDMLEDARAKRRAEEERERRNDRKGRE